LGLMGTRLARGPVADVDEQVGEERVTLLAPVDRQLGPHGVGEGWPGGRRGERRKTRGHPVLLLVVIHQA
jgi:hypothetical protein